jgi:hypothetical protein
MDVEWIIGKTFQKNEMAMQIKSGKEILFFYKKMIELFLFHL